MERRLQHGPDPRGHLLPAGRDPVAVAWPAALAWAGEDPEDCASVATEAVFWPAWVRKKRGSTVAKAASTRMAATAPRVIHRVRLLFWAAGATTGGEKTVGEMTWVAIGGAPGDEGEWVETGSHEVAGTASNIVTAAGTGSTLGSRTALMALRNSSAVWKRPEGSLAMARRTMAFSSAGMVGFHCAGGAGASLSWALSTL